MAQLGSQNSKLLEVLRAAGHILPGNFLKAWFFLNLISKPRKLVRRSLHTFYRIELVYDVLREARSSYSGKFAVLEFGTAAGYAFTKMLYATRYLGLEDRVEVHAFDSFEGLPAPQDGVDDGLTTMDWAEGQFKGDYEDLVAYCDRRYRNHRIHRGYFEDSLTPDRLEVFREQLPILVWIDCDYYSSTKKVFDSILPYLPNGCVIYFDDYEFNYGSRLTCEARFVHEFNHGLHGNDKELVLDRDLSLDSRRVYRFVRADEDAIRYPLLAERRRPMTARRRGNDSPLP